MSSGGMSQQTKQEVDPDVKDRQMQLYADTQNYLQSTGYQPYGQPHSYGVDPMSQRANNYLSQQITGQGYGFQQPQMGAPYQGAQFQSNAPNTWTSDGTRNVAQGTAPRDSTSRPGTNQYGYYPQKGTQLTTDQYYAKAVAPPTGDWDYNPNYLPTTPYQPLGNSGGGVEQPVLGGSGGGVGSAENRQAAETAQRGMFYTPQQVQAGQADHQQVGPYSADTTANVNAQNVTAQTGAQGMQGYQNAYQEGVVNQGVDDILRASQIQDQYRNQSVDAGVYGGDRQGIREAESDRATGENVSRFVNQARSQGFNTAAGLAQQDASRGLQAQLANQGAGMQAQLANQGALNQGGQFNAGLGMQGALANQQSYNQAQQFNTGLGLQGQMANQRAGLAGADQRLNAANSLSGIGTQQLQNVLGGASAMNQMGMQNTMLGQDMINRDMEMYNLSQNAGLRDIGTLQSVLQGMPVGMNSTQTSSGGSLLSGLFGLLGTGAGAYMNSR